MHIEPGLVEGGKIVLSYATATGALALAKWLKGLQGSAVVAPRLYRAAA